MGRLIDAELLKEEVRKWLGSYSCEVSIGAGFMKLIDEQPTAFDKEKVLEELEEKKIPCGRLQSYNLLSFKDGIDSAISVVKRGGIENEENT